VARAAGRRTEMPATAALIAAEAAPQHTTLWSNFTPQKVLSPLVRNTILSVGAAVAQPATPAPQHCTVQAAVMPQALGLPLLSTATWRSLTAGEGGARPPQPPQLTVPSSDSAHQFLSPWLKEATAAPTGSLWLSPQQLSSPPARLVAQAPT
jgi:hypothetical protein